MKKVYGVIYMAINIFNWHMYIGQTTQKNPLTRWRQHCNSAIKEYEYYCETGIEPCAFHCAIWQYGGMDSFIWVVIDKAYSCDELNTKEKYWISYYNTFKGKEHYNETSGGEGAECSDRIRKIRSETHKGKIVSLETRRKQSEAKKGNKCHLGHKHTDKAKRKMSEARKGMTSPRKGATLTEDTKRKLSEARKGKYTGLENPRSKQVKGVNVKTGDIVYFASCHIAGKELGINGKNIHACSSYNESPEEFFNKFNKKVLTAGGYKWFFITKEEYIEATIHNEAM